MDLDLSTCYKDKIQANRLLGFKILLNKKPEANASGFFISLNVILKIYIKLVLLL